MQFADEAEGVGASERDQVISEILEAVKVDFNVQDKGKRELDKEELKIRREIQAIMEEYTQPHTQDELDKE